MLRQENCQGQESADVLRGLPGLHAAALFLRVVAVAFQDGCCYIQNFQTNNDAIREARVIAVGSRLIQKSLLR